jgi:sortase A
MKKRRISTIILIVIFLVGLCVLLYPTISNLYNQYGAVAAIVDYDDSVKEMREQERQEMLQKAREYNENLREHPISFVNGEPSNDEYKELLDVSANQNGIMGYITIDKIDVYLPIYHGTSSEALARGAGHIEGSSLPIGGKGTHAVISGHRGLPGAKLFTDLDELVEGDTFTITVLDEVYTYEVDQIRIVLPEEVSDLDIVDGEDYVTLVTCTPYGVNTHRLLVRGHRIANLTEDTPIVADALQVDTKIVALFIAVPILVILLIWVLVHYRNKDENKKQKKEKKHKFKKLIKKKKKVNEEELL